MAGLTLDLVSAGAAQGLVGRLQARFGELAGAGIVGRFGAVGAMKEALLAGTPCDLMISTEAIVDELVAAGWLDGTTRAAIGRVATAVAVPAGTPHPDVSSPGALAQALLAAGEIFFPDPERATAGIHFARVLRELGLHDRLRARFSTHANGANAMREMAARGAARAGGVPLIGCTQATEILATAGVEWVAPLPAGLGLATVYAGAVATRAAQPALARQLLALLTAADTAGERRAAGFESREGAC